MGKTNIFMVPTERTIHIPYGKTIIEKKAPTDESIKLYEKIKEKAYNSILDTIIVNDNSLNLKAILYKDPFSWKQVCKYKVLLNGSEISGSISIKNIDLTSPSTKDDLLRKIVAKVAEKLAVDLVKLTIHS